MSPWLLCVLLWSYGVLSQSGCTDFSRVNQNQFLYYSVESLVDADLSTVEPPLDAQFTGLLGSGSCLGYAGPIGPYGPLGMLGPLGNNTWNPSFWISGLGWDWSKFSQFLTGMGGPLSVAGPLGENGPLGYNWYYGVCPCLSSFGHHLMNGGIFHILGPVGPLGALGPLGPLGPIGAHGYSRDSNGNYISGGSIQRQVTVPYNSTTSRVFDLYEQYEQSYAYKLTNNDCSFFVHGTWYYGDVPNVYNWTSQQEQFVSVLLTPIYQLNDFDFTLTIYEHSGSVVQVSSSSTLWIDHVIVKVPAQSRMHIKIVSPNIFQVYGEYRLYVTGSTSYIDLFDIVGSYQTTF
uniref:Uncharacterized protein n=1 Tax=Arcella intermedia TaxID=1963864 RepID=A0A6B2L996_9EUKA|eukprot:TRINITY_DN4446_c0_g1_i1.p1 TRINITY_DN4446_c0_g1~~TRINITY_DN4446_c0_g1_i1.p1  ORF type:complete len:346 (+),score=42.14 TRINITY_DN4446_c0_g1_i1:75-1112(+)